MTKRQVIISSDDAILAMATIDLDALSKGDQEMIAKSVAILTQLRTDSVLGAAQAEKIDSKIDEILAPEATPSIEIRPPVKYEVISYRFVEQIGDYKVMYNDDTKFFSIWKEGELLASRKTEKSCYMYIYSTRKPSQDLGD